MITLLYFPASSESPDSQTAGVLTQVAGSPFLIGAGLAPVSVAISPDGQFVFVANGGASTVGVHSWNGAALSNLASYPTDTQPVFVTVSPDGQFVFTANQGGDTVSAYSHSGGVLTPVAGSPFAAGDEPFSVVVSPDGQFLFVANQASSDVNVFSIQAGGVLAPVVGSPFPSGGAFPASITISPDGQYVFVANFGTNNLSVFSQAGGVLTPMAGSPFAAGAGANSVVVSPDGQYAFVANYSANSVSAFYVDFVPPQVAATIAVAGGTFGNGATINSNQVAQLQVQFNELMSNGANAANYQLIGEGGTAGFQTTACGAVNVGDISITVGAVTDANPLFIFPVNGGTGLPAGNYRLLVCATALDNGNNPLDGNGDGAGGDDLVRDFGVAAPAPAGGTTGGGGSTTVIIQGGGGQFVNAEFLTKTVDRTLAQIGDTLTYTITAKNPKTTPLTQVVIEDTFESGLENLQVVSTSKGTASINSNTVTVSGFSLQPGETLEIILTARVSSSVAAGEKIGNIASLESPDASVHFSNAVQVLIPPTNLQLFPADDSVPIVSPGNVTILPESLPQTGERRQ